MGLHFERIRFRIYPTKSQERFLERHFGATRWAYNFFLAKRKAEYLAGNKRLSYRDDSAYLTSLKQMDGYSWLYDVNAQSLQQSVRNLETAYTNFFQGHKKFPKFHSKRGTKSFIIPQKFSIEEKKLWIPKLQTGLKLQRHHDLPVKPKSLTIIKVPSGKFFASFLIETTSKPLPPSNKTIGIDLGLIDFLTTSDNLKIPNPKFQKKLEKKIKHQQRMLAKKKKGSKKRKRARKTLARTFEKTANQRTNFLHQTSRKLINENQVIILEDLNVAGMMKNHKLAGSIGQASWSEFVRQLSYKAEWGGRTVHQIGRFFPSSKTCHHCKFVLDSLNLKIRDWTCPSCGSKNNRDHNAALNIRDQGINDLKDMSGSGIESDKKQKAGESLSSVSVLVKRNKSTKGQRNGKRELSKTS